MKNATTMIASMPTNYAASNRHSNPTPTSSLNQTNQTTSSIYNTMSNLSEALAAAISTSTLVSPSGVAVKKGQAANPNPNPNPSNSSRTQTYYQHHNLLNAAAFAAQQQQRLVQNLNIASKSSRFLSSTNNSSNNSSNQIYSSNSIHPPGRVMSSMNSTIYPHKSIVMARHGETMNVKDR